MNHATSRKKWTREELTYGEWLRQADRSELTDAEIAMVVEEREWEEANPHIVGRLQAFIGKIVALIYRMPTVATHIDIDAPTIEPLPLGYPRGTRFEVFARVGRGLLARKMDDDGGVFMLHAKWVKIVE